MQLSFARQQHSASLLAWQQQPHDCLLCIVLISAYLEVISATLPSDYGFYESRMQVNTVRC